MKTIGIITNVDRDTEFTYTRLLSESIAKHGGRAIMSGWLSEITGTGAGCEDEEDVFRLSDIVVCLGGDGTFLKVARKAYKRDLPILGINLGNLGFLTEVDRLDIDKAIEQLFRGNYEIEERMMLEASIYRNGKEPIKDTALNDVVITRGAISRIIHVKAYVNDIFVDTYPGDGLIVSSPTGSTAYSLSAGGPIVQPDTDLILMTPICPHILYSRSFITNADSVVRAVVDEDFKHNAIVALDGEKGHEIKGGDMIEVRKSSYTTKLVRMNTRNFFNILRTKIYFRGESLKKDEVQQTCKNIGAD